jgi:RNA polymerase sigma-70 factor (ECF subfamily)
MGPARQGGGLAAVLAAALSRPELAADERLEALLEGLAAAGAVAWPTVSLPGEAFVRHLGGCLASGGDPHEALAALHATDLYLACACARGEAAAIAELERRFIETCTRFLPAADRDAIGDEVKQELRGRLLVGGADQRPAIGRYAGSGPLEGWLRVTTVRCARSLRRSERRPARRRAELDSQALLRAPDPEADFLRLRYQPEFEDALRRALVALEPRDRNLLRLHYLDGIPLDRLGRLHQVSRATATRRVAAARQALFDQTYHLLQEQLRMTRSEFESLLRYVKSDLSISIQRSLSTA